MKKGILKNGVFLVLFLAVLSLVLMGAGMDGRQGEQGTAYQPRGLGKITAPDAYLFAINNLTMPMNSSGVMADVTIAGITGGLYGTTTDVNKIFLFSGGFFLSGYSDSTLWANAVASASRVTDYLPGRVNAPTTDEKGMYVIDRDDPPFGDTWQTWKKAVDQGADFYDGDGNGEYNPIDLNGNGVWDPDEDAPDLLGDRTVWTVYNDGLAQALRGWSAVAPQKIDIQQSVFGFRSAGAIGNLLFLRYRIINRNPAVDTMQSVYFGLWADADVGDYTNDKVGCDTSRNAGYTYNSGPDARLDASFLVSFFQGPIVQTGVPTDSALDIRGQLLGRRVIYGAKNLGLSSFVNYIQSDATRGDPANHLEARNYILGTLKDGAHLEPCADPVGVVRGLPCASVDRTFWYSGNVITDYGWLYNVPSDMRQMQNIGPFTMVRDSAVDIVVAYAVGVGSSDPRASIAAAQASADISKRIYDANFAAPNPPPQVVPLIRTTDNSIELVWDTYRQVTYRDPVYDVRFEAFEVTAYNNNSTQATEGGQVNSKVIARYDLANSIGDVYVEDGSTGLANLLFRSGTPMDSVTYATPGTGRIRLLLTTDPFTGGPIIKGKPYFFSIVGYAMNKTELSTLPSGATLITKRAVAPYAANVAKIITGAGGLVGIVPGSDFNSPYLVDVNAARTAGFSDGTVTFEQINKAAITGNKYEVSFFRDTTKLYNMRWRLTNLTTNTIKLDSVRENRREGDPSAGAYPSADGVAVRVVGVDPGVSTPVYGPSAKWYSSAATDTTSGVFYLGNDLPKKRPANYSPIVLFDKVDPNNLMSVDKLRRIEIRFGPTQKAYRYMQRGGTVFADADRFKFMYAASTPVNASRFDTLPNFGKGFVDVPFQVWVKDSKYGEERQLACGFLETAALAKQRRNANGIWDPGTLLNAFNVDSASLEYIVIFDSPYTPDTNVVFTGGTFNGVTRWANVLDGWTVPTQWDTTILDASQRKEALAPFFGGLFLVGMQRRNATSFYTAGDVYTIPINYPFTAADAFTFQTTVGGVTQTQDDRKQLFSKVNVFPNPLFAYNQGGSYMGRNPDAAFVTFSNLPEVVTIKIYTLSGTLLRTLNENDKSRGVASPYLEWDLKNDQQLRVASGMYLAIVSSPDIGEKVLKFAVIMPQKQIQYY